MKQKKSRTTLLQIAQLGHPIVGKKAKPIGKTTIKDLKQLIDNMIVTCKDVMGVGIAAPQVYQPLKLFIIASAPTSRYPKAPKMKPLAIINPKIISFSSKKTKDWEGCLSIPGIRGFVPRYTAVTVRFTTREGKQITREFKGFLARIFQHEYDHIEGKVFLDTVESTKDLMSEKEYQKMIRG